MRVRSIGLLLLTAGLSGCGDDPPEDRDLDEPPTLDGTVLEAQGEALERARGVEAELQDAARARLDAVDAATTGTPGDDEEG